MSLKKEDPNQQWWGKMGLDAGPLARPLLDRIWYNTPRQADKSLHEIPRFLIVHSSQTEVGKPTSCRVKTIFGELP